MMDSSLVELLSRLVAIPSVNPEDTPDTAITGEGRLAEFVGRYLAQRGFELAWDDRASGRPNLMASFGPADARRSLLLEAHLDTVGVAGMTRPPFAPVVEEGRLYGRGACDTKGPMAAALWALAPDVLERIEEANWRLFFVGAMGEEKGNQGAERLVKKGLVRADEALILEPTGLALVCAHKGSLWFELEVGGRAGHGSDPAGGLSAIEGMCDAMEVLHKEAREAQARFHDPLLGGPTVNIGKISGGAAVNVVADRCVVEVDRRTLPAEDHAEILQRVRTGLEGLREEGRILSFDLWLQKDSRPFQGGQTSRLVRRLEAAGRACGIEPRVEGTGWYSDAGAFAEVCPEVVVFGPGRIAQAHTADEYIDLDELECGGEVLKHLLSHLPADDAETERK